MDFYEEVVHFYLTDHKELAVLPQAKIKKNVSGHPWEADLDFMGVDFTKRNIYLVEVSSSTGYPIKICERLKEQNYKNIESYVRTEILRNELPSYTLSWWFFIRSRHADKVKKDLAYLTYVEAGGHCEVTALEDVLCQFKEKLN